MDDKYTISTAELTLVSPKQSYNITFHKDGKQIGVLDFNGPAMTFEGEADDSAKVFFDWIAQSFYGRLQDERAAEREACAKWYAEKGWLLDEDDVADAMRERDSL